MIRIAIALAMIAVLGREAASESATVATPRLKELVMVTGELVRIGDLVENAGDTADAAVFRAPDLGHTGTVRIARILNALRPHGLDLDPGEIDDVVVTRLSRTLTANDIKERIARAVAGQHAFGDAGNLAVTLDRNVGTMHVEADIQAELSIVRLNIEPRSGRFDVLLDLPGSSAARRLPLRFTGSIVETVESLIATRTLARGEIIRAGDVVVERRRKSEARGEPIDFDRALGLATKRTLRSGQLLHATDLMKPEVVQRNEAVTILYEVPGITLTVRGKALEAGAVGDVIGILNIQSKRTVQATVAGPGQVVITATRPRLAAAAAQPSAQ